MFGVLAADFFRAEIGEYPLFQYTKQVRSQRIGNDQGRVVFPENNEYFLHQLFAFLNQPNAVIYVRIQRGPVAIIQGRERTFVSVLETMKQFIIRIEIVLWYSLNRDFVCKNLSKNMENRLIIWQIRPSTYDLSVLAGYNSQIVSL